MNNSSSNTNTINSRAIFGSSNISIYSLARDTAVVELVKLVAYSSTKASVVILLILQLLYYAIKTILPYALKMRYLMAWSDGCITFKLN